MSLSNNIRLLISSVLTRTVGLADVTSNISKSITETLATADAVYSANAALTGGVDDYDLQGSLTDPMGQTVTFATVKALLIINTSDYPLVIGAANNITLLTGSTDKLTLAAGATHLLIDPTGIAVTAGTADLITIASGVAAWSAGSYAEGDVVLHSGTLYQANTATSNEPPHADWTALSAQTYELLVIGTAPV